MGAHFDNIASELAKLGVEVADTLEAEELAAGGFVSDLEVRSFHSALRPRLPRMIRGLLAKAVQKYESVPAGDLINMIDNLFREKKSEGL